MKYFKYIFILLLVFTLSSCKKDDSNILVGMRLIGPEVIEHQIDVDDFENYQIEITYENGDTETIYLTSEMILDYDIDLFSSVGIKDIDITYDDFESTVRFKVYETDLDLELVTIFAMAMDAQVTELSYEEWLDSIRGVPGEDGEDGIDGLDGIGIESVQIDVNGHLVITYTNTLMRDVGLVVGTDGIDGINGTDGVDGTNGEDGTDGVGFDGFYVVNFYSISGFIISSQIVVAGEDAIDFIPELPNGYIFDNWDTGFTNVTSDLDVLPIYHKELYTINFNYPGTDSITEIEYRDTATLPIPENHGYVFLGWYTGETVNSEKIYDTTLITDNLELYPQWEIGVYNISFDAVGGVEKESMIIYYQPNISLGINPTKTGSVFLGWYCDSEYVEEFSFNDYEPGLYNLYAKWIEMDISILSGTLHGHTGTWIEVNSYLGDEPHVVLPDEIDGIEIWSINSNAFSSKDIESIVLPNNLISIGDYALSYNPDLLEVVLPSSLEIIGDGVFSNNDSLLNVEFNSSVDIPFKSFQSTPSLGNIIIPDGATIIESYAFSYSGITGITIPDSVLEIENNAFEYSINLVSIIFPDGITEVQGNTFRGAASLTDVVLPGTIEVIRSYAFIDSGLQNINLPNSILSIGDNAFEGTNITTAILPGYLFSLGESVFKDAIYLTEVFVPDDVITLHTNSFEGTIALEEINVEMGSTNYASIDGVLYDSAFSTLMYYPRGKTNSEFVIAPTVTAVDDFAVAYNQYLMTIVFPDTYTASWDNNLRELTNLLMVEVYENGGPDYYTSVNGILYADGGTILVKYGSMRPDPTFTVPTNVEVIGEYAFEGTWSLITLTLPTGLSEISEGGFKDMPYLANIVIPANVGIIGAYAFYNCDSITDLVFSTNYQHIEDYTFAEMDNLTNLSLSVGILTVGEYIISNSPNNSYLGLIGSEDIDRKAFFGMSVNTNLVVGGGYYEMDEHGAIYMWNGYGFNILSHYPANVKSTSYTTRGDTELVIALFGDNTYLRNFDINVKVVQLGNDIFFDIPLISTITIERDELSDQLAMTGNIFNDNYSENLIIYVSFHIYESFTNSIYIPSNIVALCISY